MRWALVAVVACSTPASSPPRLENVTTTPPSKPSIIDDVVRAELEHWLRDPAWLPEAKALGSAGPIFVEREIEISKMSGDTLTTDVQQIPPSALPAAPRTFTLRPKSALQADADRSGREIQFIELDITFFAGKPDAHVDFGVRMVHPSTTQPTVIGFCGATDLFEKRDGHWTLTKRRGLVCP